MLTSENLSDVGHMLTEGPIPMFIEEIIRRLCQEVVGSTVARASDMRRVDKEVMRWISFHLDEELRIAQLDAQRSAPGIGKCYVVRRVAMNDWFKLGWRRASRSPAKSKPRTS